jgi:hypothetical protein
VTGSGFWVPGVDVRRALPAIYSGGILMFRVFIHIFFIVMVFSESGLCGETIYAKELENYMYIDGKMKHSKGQFEITYLYEGDKIIRTRVYDLNKNEVIPDNTVYQTQRQLWSDPETNLPLKKQVIRGVGQPGKDAIEILSIEIDGDFIQSVKSTSNYFIISRYKRIK